LAGDMLPQGLSDFNSKSPLSLK